MLRVVFDNLTGEGDLVTLTDPVTGLSGYDDTHALETAVILSLLCDAPARESDNVPEGDDKRGWWADSYPLEPGDEWGSRLWLLERSKVTPSTLNDARATAEESLQWMIDDGVADSVEVQTSWVQGRLGFMRILVGIRKPGDLAPQWLGPWENYYGEV